MPRGGARKGAGRPVGRQSKHCQAVRELQQKAIVEAVKTGEKLPHEILFEAGKSGKLGEETLSATLRLNALQAAAPFYGAKLATVEHKVSKIPDGNDRLDVARRVAYLLKLGADTATATDAELVPAELVGPVPETMRQEAPNIPVSPIQGGNNG